MRRGKAAAALACALSLNAAVASAEILDGELAVLPSDFGYGNAAIYIYGFEFSLAAPIRVTGLAYYQDPVEDADDPHLVRLWDAVGKSVLASATVGPSSSAVQAGIHAFWASALESPLTLGPGTYAVSGSASSADWFLQSLNPVAAPGIDFVRAIYENPGVDSYPSGATGGVVFGANLLFSPVPEPGSALLLLAGLAGVALFVLRGRRSG